MAEVKSEQKRLPGVLDGIRIVEYGVFHAGPGGNAILGDLGADIVKIETFAGDPERYWTRVAGSDFSKKTRKALFLMPRTEIKKASVSISSNPKAVKFSSN